MIQFDLTFDKFKELLNHLIDNNYVKVDKNGVWDNREGAGEEIAGAAEDKDDQKAATTNYTEFKEKPGKFGEGHMIRLTK